MPPFVFSEAAARRKKAGTLHFGMEYTIDLSSVLGRIEGVVRQTTQNAANFAMEDAKRLAPVRRVVAGDRGGKTRTLTRQERSAEQSVRVQLGLRSGKVIRTAAEDRRIRSLPSNPYLRAPGRRPPRSAPPEGVPARGGGFAVNAGVQLNRYGRAEANKKIIITGPTVYGQASDAEVRRNRLLLKRSNSAVFRLRTAGHAIDPALRGGGEYRLGGRLRGEIYTEEADTEAGIVKWWVISPTYYARYVEFGTRHNKAQPYLRPALAIQRRRFADQMRTNLRKLNWKPKRKHVRTRVI